MSFNPDLNKKAQEVVFSRKLNKSSHPKISFNNAPVVCASCQKYFGMFLDESLNFSYHIKEKMPKAIKGIDIIQYRIQYNAPLAVTGSIKRTSQRKLYNELAFESLKFKVGFGGYVLFIKSNKLSTRIPV